MKFCILVRAMPQNTEDTNTELKREGGNIFTGCGGEARHDTNGSLLFLGLASGIVMCLNNT